MKANQSAARIVGQFYRQFITKSKLSPGNFLRFAYNDALSFNPANNSGGADGSIYLRKQRRHPMNKNFVLLMEEMKIYKSLDAPVVFDFFSYADFIQFGAYQVILVNEGPKYVRQFRFGRVDKSQDDATKDEDSQILAQFIPDPKSSDFLKRFEQKGFTKEETLALGAIQAYDFVKPKQQYQWKHYHKFDNFYFKNLLQKQSHNPDLQQDSHFLNDLEMKDLVSLYAEDNQAFLSAFKSAFIKMSELGQTSSYLRPIGDLTKYEQNFFDIAF